MGAHKTKRAMGGIWNQFDAKMHEYQTSSAVTWWPSDKRFLRTQCNLQCDAFLQMIRSGGQSRHSRGQSTHSLAICAARCRFEVLFVWGFPRKSTDIRRRPQHVWTRHPKGCVLKPRLLPPPFHARLAYIQCFTCVCTCTRSGAARRVNPFTVMQPLHSPRLRVWPYVFLLPYSAPFSSFFFYSILIQPLVTPLCSLRARKCRFENGHFLSHVRTLTHWYLWLWCVGRCIWKSSHRHQQSFPFMFIRNSQSAITLMVSVLCFKAHYIIQLEDVVRWS